VPCLKGVPDRILPLVKKACTQRRRQDEIIKEQIVNIFNKSRKTYGSPRIHKQLGREGIHCSKKRVERLMREAGDPGYPKTPIRGNPRLQAQATGGRKHLK